MHGGGGGGGGGGGASSCVTVNVFPPAAIVALRTLPVLTATVNATVPLPVPDCPAVTVIQGALVVAVHAHVFADEVIAIEPTPPTAPKNSDVGEIENVHAGGGAAACAMVKVFPATVSVPLRAAPAFAATR